MTCKEKCDSSVSVALVRLDAKSHEEKLTVGLTDQSSEFLFQNVLPGKYALEVYPSFTPKSYGNFCLYLCVLFL